MKERLILALGLVLLGGNAIRAANWVDYRGRTTMNGTGNMFYPREEWGQVIGLLLFAILEDCETDYECQLEWDDEYWGEKGDLPVGNFQTELGLGRYVSANLNLGGRVLFRLDRRDDPLRYVWAWGPELTYYFTTRYPTLRTYVGGGAYWSRGRLAPVEWLDDDREAAKTIAGTSSQWRAGLDVAMTPDASMMIQLNYQRDRLDDIDPYARNGLALGIGLNFTLY